MATQLLTLGELLHGSLAANGSSIIFSPRNENSCFRSGHTYQCYCTKGVNMVYDDRGREWSKRTIAGMKLSKGHLERYFGLDLQLHCHTPENRD